MIGAVVVMSEIQKELNNRIIKCIKRETGIDLTDIAVRSALTIEDSAVITEYGFKCLLKVFRKLAKRKFANWILDELQKVETDATRVGERLIRFSSKVGDPVDVFAQLTLLGNILENLIEDIDDEELLESHSAILRLLAISYLGELNNRVFVGSLRPLLFSVDMAQEALTKDMSWCTSVLALTIEEQLVRKKAIESGLAIKEDEQYNSVLEKLTAHLDEQRIRQSREILLADAHRKIRNKVLHRNWSPTEDEMDDIVSHVLKVVNFLKTEIESKKQITKSDEV